MSCPCLFLPNRGLYPKCFTDAIKALFGLLGINLTVGCYKSSCHYDIDKDVQEKMDRAKEIAGGKKTQIPGVYVFLLDDYSCDRCLKVGKVGNINDGRWYYQHYHLGSAQSTLLDSIAIHPELFKNSLKTEESDKRKILPVVKIYNKIKKKRDGELLNLSELYLRIKDKTEEKLQFKKGEKTVKESEISKLLEILKNHNIIDSDREKKFSKIDKIYKEKIDKAKKWLEDNTCRLEFIFDEEDRSNPTYSENFLEGYLHWLLKPCYEGS